MWYLVSYNFVVNHTVVWGLRQKNHPLSREKHSQLSINRYTYTHSQEHKNPHFHFDENDIITVWNLFSEF